MIGRLTGKLIAKQAPELVLDVGGVGYELQAPMSTFYRLPNLGDTLMLYTHFVVREDAQQLYGFSQEQERALFRSLIKVNGVGPKLALTILSSIEPDAFVRCVTDNDSANLVRLPGVGKKTAERLIIEMRDRLNDWYQDSPTLPVMNTPAYPASPKTFTQDAISALVALGYKPTEASRAIAQVTQEVASSEELIKLALKGMLRAC